MDSKPRDRNSSREASARARKRVDAARIYICDRCGNRMVERQCKVICMNCGNRFDCSDLNIYFD